MPTFDFKSPDGKTYSVQGPDGATPEQASQMLQQHLGSDQPAKPQGFMANAMDAVKGIPRNLLAGVMDAATSGAQAEAHGMSQPDLAADIPNTEQALKAVEPVTGRLYEPQGTAGKIVGAGARMVTNPASYVGPGGLPLKVGASILSGMGSEGAGQATEGTKYESAARVAGALAGGVTGAKMLGPAVEKAAIPTAEELIASGKKGLNAARTGGLELDPTKVGALAQQAQQDLERNGPSRLRAPEVHQLLDDLQSAPAGSKFTAANLDDLRGKISDYAQEVTPTGTGQFKPTPNAAAASKIGDRLKQYMEDIPEDHVVAGDPANYVATVKQANADYAAGMRAKGVGGRLDRAENAVNRQVAGSLDSQIKAKLAPILDNPEKQRGFSPEEIAQVELTHNGTFGSNILRQLGRGGAGVVPLGAHVSAAALTGGASIPTSIAIGTPLYAARKIAEVLTKNRAAKLDDMLRSRSPLYQSRVAALPAPDLQSNRAAVARALLAIR